MTYSLIIKQDHADPIYVNNIETWGDVVNHLKFNLPFWVISVTIYKYSSNNRTLASRFVTMSTMWNMVNSPTDKILY